MHPKEVTAKSKRLSYILRHDPASAGVTLDAAGWVTVDQLLTSLGWERSILDHVVADNNKKRFEYNEGRTRIRASQGHSVDVDLGYTEQVPPDVLYHGTTKQAYDTILREGLVKMSRHHVHLSADKDTALVVARRRPNPVLLVVDAAAMARAGEKFYLSTNGVWLVDAVDPKYLRPA